jgi:hypothetical protein
MQQQRARTLEQIPNKALEPEYEKGNKIAGFFFLLAGLIVDQQCWRENGRQESRRLSQTLTDELGECMMHLIKEADMQGIKLPVVTSGIRGERRHAVSVRNSGVADCYWVDIADIANAKPRLYSVLVRTYSASEESAGTRGKDQDAAGG